jgi:hypothetical protein
MALSLKDVPARDGQGRTYNCIFWDSKGCKVYEDRPIQCSTYPFWDSIINSKASWQYEARSCPGIDKGDTQPRSLIEECLLARRKAGTIVLAYGVDPEYSDENSILGSSGLGSDSSDAVEGEE